MNWSAEPQSMLIDAGLGKDVESVLNQKIVWPYPAKNDGEDGWQERAAIAKINRFKGWKGKGSKWNLQDG